MGWANPHQAQMLLSLLASDISTFSLVS
jgi:hypothetical protein